jgi:C4-dicarboxylate-specific signal transduction histidine kinase
MNLEALAASMSHEAKQPLAAISMNAGAARRFLAHEPPNLEEVRSSLERMTAESHRIGYIFDSIRDLFRRGDHGRSPTDVNEIVLEALGNLRGELKDGDVSTRVELTPALPLITGHRGQLQEVLANLVHNAIEAMRATEVGGRLVRVSTAHHGRDEIVVAVEDSGPGIDQERVDEIFEPFVTTKPEGMGLGLAFCRMIVERHGGRLMALPGKGMRGAHFQIILPTG